MANFMKAVDWMKQGKKVRWSLWEKEMYIEFLPDGDSVDNKGNLFNLHINHSNNDWEIYEEEDNWNLKECILTGDYNYVLLSDINKLKEKILEDEFKLIESLVVNYEKTNIKTSAKKLKEELIKIKHKRFGF